MANIGSIKRNITTKLGLAFQRDEPAILHADADLGTAWVTAYSSLNQCWTSIPSKHAVLIDDGDFDPEAERMARSAAARSAR